MIWYLASVCLLPVLYIVARYIWELVRIGDLSRKAVIITGCDTGFGRELAVRCIKEGFTVFAGCLTQKGEDALKRLCPSPKLHTVPLDVTSEESVQNAKKFVEENLETGIELWGIVNNAGVFSCYGPDDWTTIKDYVNAAEVNTFGVIRVTKAFKNHIKRSEGRVVTVTSVNGRLSSPAAGPYVVSKFGAEAYMDSIRQELTCMGVKVCILEPGAFRTNLLDENAMIARVEQVWSKLDDETRGQFGEEFKDYFTRRWNEVYTTMSSTKIHYVVDNYVHALTAKFPRHRYYCGWDAILVFVPMSLLPTWLSDFFIECICRQEIDPIIVRERKMKKSKKI